MQENRAQTLAQIFSQTRALLQEHTERGVRYLSMEDSELQLPPCSQSAKGEPLRSHEECRRETLAEVRSELGECRRCALASTRNRLVFGDGDPHARLVFVGEGPGREEDERGEPFVGEAGRLLERMLFAMKLERREVYICNVIKCRPPGNRNPQPEEIQACEPFLQRQLKAIQPQVIVALGKFAAQTLLQQQTPISQLRGRWQQYAGIPLMPTFHPAYLLRNPAGKKEVWEDLKLVLQRLQQED
ncbi:MAG: uracil-DNA glycosylase [Desulfuromonadaceae bacterium]|nr:uracil-DNA glycosylase [Desulfuromonadaceae bacterium]